MRGLPSRMPREVNALVANVRFHGFAARFVVAVSRFVVAAARGLPVLALGLVVIDQG